MNRPSKPMARPRAPYRHPVLIELAAGLFFALIVVECLLIVGAAQ